MAYEFRLRFFTPSGVGIGETNDFLDLACSTRVNDVGRLQAVMRGEAAVLQGLETNARAYLDWRDLALDPPMPWTRFIRGIYRHQIQSRQQARVFTLEAVSTEWLLRTRTNAYPANTSNRTRFLGVPAETIMKTMVQYNLTASATTGNGRIRAGTAWPATLMTIQADAAGGNVLDWYAAHDTLLDNFQKMIPVAGGDFSVEPLSNGTYEFRFHPGQLGTDRSADVVFSLENGNMANPVYAYDRIEEATAVIVGGQGEGSDRDFVSRTGPDYSTDNDIETFTDATDVEKGNVTGLNVKGDRHAEEVRARKSFTFDVLQTTGSRLGLHYFPGDLVTAVNPETGDAEVQKVVGADLSFDGDGNPVVAVAMEAPYA